MLYTIEVDGTRQDVVGSLRHDSGIITEDKTFILVDYVIPCNGIVVAWEFCYRISGAPSATFYPGIWRITKTHKKRVTGFKLVQSNNVTFDPSGTVDNLCKSFTLPVIDQFTAPAGSVIGLYSNKGVVRPLLLVTDDISVTTYQYNKNKSEVKPNKNKDVNYNIAIRVHIGKLHMPLYYSCMASYLLIVFRCIASKHYFILIITFCCKD